jgi:hypothetical protein
MKSSVQARLDRQSQAALARLVRRLGWSPSKLCVKEYGFWPPVMLVKQGTESLV